MMGLIFMLTWFLIFCSTGEQGETGLLGFSAILLGLASKSYVDWRLEEFREKIKEASA